MKSALHSSSNRVKPYRALHVLPKPTRAGASRRSRNCASSSSGSMAKKPALAFRLKSAVRALPAGFTLSGCRGMAAAGSSLLSVSEQGSAESSRSLFVSLASDTSTGTAEGVIIAARSRGCARPKWASFFFSRVRVTTNWAVVTATAMTPSRWQATQAATLIFFDESDVTGPRCVGLPAHALQTFSSAVCASALACNWLARSLQRQGRKLLPSSTSTSHQTHHNLSTRTSTRYPHDSPAESPVSSF